MRVDVRRVGLVVVVMMTGVHAASEAAGKKKSYPPEVQKVIDKADGYIVRKVLKEDPLFKPYFVAVNSLHHILEDKEKNRMGFPPEALTAAQNRLLEVFANYAKGLTNKLGRTGQAGPSVSSAERQVGNAIVKFYNEHFDFALILVEELYRQLDHFPGEEKRRQEQVYDYLGRKWNKHDFIYTFVDELLEDDWRKPKGRMRKVEGLEFK